MDRLTPTVSFPLTFQRGAHPLQEARLSARSGRRRRLMLTERLSGDLANLGYFSTELRIGTPAQRFNVIVDTGSSVTAVPCAGCTRCGSHANDRFDPSLSLTFRHLTCRSPRAACRHCEASTDRCAYSVAYQEGSSYKGYLARDVVHFGAASPPAEASTIPRGASQRRARASRHRANTSAPAASAVPARCVALDFAFGCSTEETGLFRSQRADGIMGLASSRALDAPTPTILEALVRRGIARSHPKMTPRSLAHER